MTEHTTVKSPYFFLTVPTPCPYLPGRMERKVFTRLTGGEASSLNNMLTHAGFRRSQSIAYKPACDQCQACVSVRIPVDSFAPGRWMRRIHNRNADLWRAEQAPVATEEQFALLRGYLRSRHPGGGMADMDVLDYAAMIEDSPVPTHVAEYRDARAQLKGACLIDRLSDGLSLVYSFYAPDEAGRSLGSYIILDSVARARELRLPYVYLGYWIDGCRKMLYKRRFQPLEGLSPEGWRTLPASQSQLTDSGSLLQV